MIEKQNGKKQKKSLLKQEEGKKRKRSEIPTSPSSNLNEKKTKFTIRTSRRFSSYS